MSLLRTLRASDAAPLADLYLRNREFLAPWEPAREPSWFTETGQAEAIAVSLERDAAGACVSRVICDEAGELVGRANLNNIVRGAFQSASVGYWLSEHANGRGLATRAVLELTGLAFTEFGLHRVEAGTIPENVRSQAVLRRAGFEQFGYAVRYLQIAARWRDHLLFQRLAPAAAAS